jgi:hypothetical protein
MVARCVRGVVSLGSTCNVPTAEVIDFRREVSVNPDVAEEEWESTSSGAVDPVS